MRRGAPLAELEASARDNQRAVRFSAPGWRASMSWRWLGLLLALGLCGGCAPAEQQAAPPRTIVVFAAASLTDALEAAATAFAQQAPDVRVSFNFAGSQQLAQQIINGAPADIYAPANLAQMEQVVAAGQISAAAVKPFARNRLVVVTPADNPGAIVTLHDLAAPGKLIVLADAAVPAGGYALEMLANASADPAFGAEYGRRVLANVVSYEDSVRAVLTKVLLGEADAGIVYASDATARTAAGAAQAVNMIDIPAALNVVAVYPLAVVANAAQPAAAAAFVDFLLSPAGQAILQDFGLQPVGDGNGP